MIQYSNKALGRAVSTGVIGLVQGATKPERSFFGRLWRGAVRVAIQAIPGELAEALLEAFGASIDEISRGSIYVAEDGTALISDVENIAIENWITRSFAPKYKAMVEKATVLMQTTNAQLQLKLINEINNELAIVKEYLNWDNPKLSQEAQKQRNELVTELIGHLEHIIFKAIEASPVEYIAENKAIESTADLLFPIVSFVKFQATATNYTLGNAIVPTDSAPVDMSGENQPKPTNEAPKNPQSSNSLLKLGGFLLAGVVIGKLVSN